MAKDKNTQTKTESAWEIWYEFCCKIKEEERRRWKEEYERRRRERLGDCYAEQLDDSIGDIVTVVVGWSLLDTLRIGDKVLVKLNVFEDPCIMRKIGDKIYVDGYVPIYSKHCRCKHSDYDYFAIIRAPMYVKGLFPTDPLPYVVAEYKGNGIFEITADKNYDYFLYFDVVYLEDPNYEYVRYVKVDVEGAVWHSAYCVLYGDTVRDIRSGDTIAELSPCCYDDVVSKVIVLTLIRRGETAKIRYHTKEEFEDTIRATFPPDIDSWETRYIQFLLRTIQQHDARRET